MEPLKCPSCRKPLQAEKSEKYRPFCSERCKMADLARWLDEEYTISRPISMLDLADVN